MPNEESSPQMNSQSPTGKRNLLIIASVLTIVIVLAAIWFVFLYPSGAPTTIAPVGQTQTAPEIKSDADLQKLEDEVKSVDVDGLSKDLDLNDQDASQF